MFIFPGRLHFHTFFLLGTESSMSTSVTNVSVKHIRPAYANLAEWCADPKNVYIGRAGVVFIEGKRYPSAPSPLANPFKIGRDGTREDVLEKFEAFTRRRLEVSPQLLRELEGKTLGCWCKPDACHGDILVKIMLERQKPL